MSATVETLTATHATAISHGRLARARAIVEATRALPAAKNRGARGCAARDRSANDPTTVPMAATNTAMVVPRRSPVRSGVLDGGADRQTDRRSKCGQDGSPGDPDRQVRPLPSQDERRTRRGEQGTDDEERKDRVDCHEP